MEKKVDLVIVIPIYNPPQNWYESVYASILKIEVLFQYIKFQIVFVNDGSSKVLATDFKMIKDEFDNIEFLSYPENKGKGYAIRHGLKNHAAAHYIYTDWDFPFGEAVLLDVYNLIKYDAVDLVVSTRSQKYYEALPMMRRIISFCSKIVTYFYLVFNRMDTQAGLKGLNENAYQLFLQTTTNSFMFELEFVRACIRKKLNIRKVIVDPKDGILFSNFGMKTLYREFISCIKILIK
jgi:glycosyltransferase involved in cell wall biosynthesis